MTSALALFGNGTLFHTARESGKKENELLAAARSICGHKKVPFHLYGQASDLNDLDLISPACHGAGDDVYDKNLLLPQLVGGLMQLFNKPVSAQQLLEMTAFFANEALLMTTAGRLFTDTRVIYTSPGYLILKPRKSIPVLVILSFLISLQVIGLLILIRFIYSAPSWTELLDSLTLARIGAQLKEQGKDLDSASVSGVIGMGEREEVIHQPEDPESPVQKRTTYLALGEPGLVSRSAV